MFGKENLPNIADFYYMYPHPNPSDYMKYVVSKIRDEGHILEFGVYKGKTINRIASQVHPRIVYGFDSFEGLNEDWGTVNKRVFKKGAFKTDANKISIKDNVKLIKGYFEDTLPKFEVKEQIAFIHIDSDLYQSAMTVLSHLNEWIGPDTIIAFDELAYWEDPSLYAHYQEHEWKALRDWTTQFDRKFEILARSMTMQGAIRILDGV